MDTGPGLVDRLGASFDALCDDVDTHVHYRRPWLSAWCATHPSVEPWAVLVGRPGERLDAVALLGRQRVRGGWRLCGLGDTDCDRRYLPARTAGAGAELAHAITAQLGRLHSPWWLDLRQLPVGDAVAEQLLRDLPLAERVPGQGRPLLHLRGDRRLRAHVSRNSRKKYRNFWNRLDRAGHHPVFDRTRDADAIAGALPQLMAIHVARDHDVGRPSTLDQPTDAAFFRRAVGELAHAGQVELTRLLVDDGTTIAYDLALLDGGTYCIWNGHFDPDWADYSPGHVLDVGVIDQVLQDSRWRAIDWMRGEASYKIRMANDMAPAQDLRAWSSRRLRARDRAIARTRDAVHAVRDRHERADRAWRGARRSLERLRARSRS